MELDFAAILAGLIILAVLACSAILWILHRKRSKDHCLKKSNAPDWPIGWLNFGIFLCAIITSVAFTQIIAGKLIHLIDHSSENQQINEPIKSASETDTIKDIAEVDSPELNPSMAVLAVLSLQIPMLLTFYGLRRFFPDSFAGPLNKRSVTTRQAFMQAIPLFIQYLPVIWLASLLWSGCLTILQKLEIIDDFPPQELIQIFNTGGSPVAITVLVIFAITLAPIIEEIIFRGGIYRFLKSQTRLLPAQVLSSLFFAVMHGNLMSFLPLVVVGILLTHTYERSGNLLTPIAFHACFNGFNLLMLFIINHSSIPID